MINKTTTWFAVTLILALVLKVLHNQSQTQDLFFMLWPACNLIELLFNTHAYWNADGFHFYELPVQLNKYYSGGNLFVISFLIVSGSAPYYLFNTFKASLLFIGTLLVAYLFTIGVTVMKVTITLLASMLRGAPLWLDNPRAIRQEHLIMHLLALLIIYLAMKICFTRLKRYSLKHASVYSLNK